MEQVQGLRFLATGGYTSSVVEGLCYFCWFWGFFWPLFFGNHPFTPQLHSSVAWSSVNLLLIVRVVPAQIISAEITVAEILLVLEPSDLSEVVGVQLRLRGFMHAQKGNAHFSKA